LTTKNASSEGDESITLQVLLAHDVTTLVKTIQSQTNDIILPKLPANAQDLPLLKGNIGIKKKSSFFFNEFLHREYG
jgi:hypothetical protein